MAETLDIKGFKEVSKKLKDMPKKLRNKYVRRALRKAGKVIVDDAKGRVPVDTGLLKRKIVQRSGRKSLRADVIQRIGVDGGGRKPKNDDEIIPYYWRFVEFGTKKRPEASPFLRPAFESQKFRALKIFTREMKKGLARGFK